MPDRTIEYTRQAIVPIQKDTSLDPVYDQQLLKLKIHLVIVDILWVRGYLQFSAERLVWGPINYTILINGCIEDAKSNREDGNKLYNL